MGDNRLDAILIGLGSVTEYYGKGLKNTGVYRLKYVYDLKDDSDSSRWYSSINGVRRVSTEEYRNILKKRSVDVAIIATPPHTHVEIMRECIDNGILPIVEKPLTDREEEFRELSEEGLDYRVMLHWKYGAEVLAFLKDRKSLKIKSIEVSIEDPYLSGPGRIDPDYFSKDGCWIDGGINAISILSQFVNLKKAKVKSFKVRIDPVCMQPYHAECKMKVGRTDVSIMIGWNSDGIDMKTTVIYTDKGRYVLNHSGQSIMYPDGSNEICSEGLRLANHYLHLFSKNPDELTGSSELQMIHKLLYEPMKTPKSPFYARVWITLRTLLENIIFAETAKYKAIFLLLGILLGFLFLSLSSLISINVLSEILKQLGTVVFSTVGVLLASMIFKWIEDRRKVTNDDGAIKALYGEAYRCDFYINAKPCSLYYDCLHERMPDEEVTYHVIDLPNKQFCPDDFIRQHAVSILSAHKHSRYSNFDTLRLDDFKAAKDSSGRTVIVLNTSRSTYVSHMITNRAVDYMIDGNVSLRQIYEYKKLLSPLAESRFSNHLALIGMIVLNDGYVLFPHRTSKSTISKNMITSGMAVAFKLDDAGRNFSSKGTNAVFEDYIYDRLASAMKIDRSCLSKDDVDIQLIGAGRDVYEGGKPSCFYQITIKNMDSKEYLVKTKKFLSSNRHEEVLDSNKRVYVVDFKLSSGIKTSLC